MTCGIGIAPPAAAAPRRCHVAAHLTTAVSRRGAPDHRGVTSRCTWPRRCRCHGLASCPLVLVWLRCRLRSTAASASAGVRG